MNKLLVVFPKETGGEWVAMKNIASQLHKKFPKLVQINMIEGLEIVWDEKEKFQLARNFLKSLFLYGRITLQAVGKKIDNTYSNSLLFLFVFNILNRFRNREIKLFYHFHGARHESLEEEIKKESNLARKYFYIFPFYLLITSIEKYALSVTKKIFIPSKSAVKELESLWGSQDKKRVKIVVSGFEPKIFYPKRSPRILISENFKLLYVGRIIPVKRIELVIAAFQNLRKEIRCQLNIVYPKISDMEISHWFSSLTKNVEDVNLFSNLKNPNIADKYREANLTLLLSAKEHFPLVYLESIACGTPVVTSDIPAISSLQKKIWPKLIVSNFESKGISDSILKYYHLSQININKIRKRCIQSSKGYTWERSTNLVLDAINEKD